VLVSSMFVTPGESIIQGTPDPQRGNQQIGGGAPVLFLFGGNPALRSERAVQVTVGTVINPAARVSTRILTTLMVFNSITPSFSVTRQGPCRL
jgi:outer membrane receptor protein involved in Fe transport